MPTELERLVVSLEASITKYEKTMARAAGIADNRAKQIEKRFGGLEGVLKNFGKNALVGFVTGVGGAVAAALSLTAVINGTKAALQQFGNISDQSAAAGVDPEFFQGIAYQAKLAGVEVDGVASALAAFNKNSGQAVEGRGKLATTLQAMNPELLKGIQLATTQEQRFLLVADAISKSQNASERATIAAAAFGDQGTKLVAVLANGADEIERINRNAKDMGIIVERDLIARADELGDKLDTAATIVQTKLNVALVDLAPLLVDAAGLASEFAKALAIVYEQTKAIEQRQFLSPLQNQLAETYNKIQPLKERIAELQKLLEADGGENWRVSLDISDAEASLATLTAQANQLLNRIQELQGFKPPAPAGPPVDPREALYAGMTGRGGEGRIKPVEPFYTPGGGTKTRNEAADATIKQAEAVEQLIADLQFEQSLIGKTAEEQNLLNTLRRAGVDATSAQGVAIATLVQGIDAQKAAQDRLNQAMQENQQIAAQAGEALSAALDDGRLSAQELLGVLVDVGKQLLLNAIANAVPGGSILTSFLGGLFGGGRAKGGPVSPGKIYEVNENTPRSELFMPTVPGMIIPRTSARGGGGGRGGGEVRVVLQDDSGRMAAIADQRIETASGVIVNVSVAKSLDAVHRNQARLSADAQQRFG